MSEEAKDKAEAPPAKSKSMLVIIIAAVGGIAITGVVMFFVMGNKSSGPDPAKAAPVAVPTNEFGPVVDMPDFVVNIQSEEGTAYLKVKISLELIAETATETVNKAMPVLRNEVLMYLSSLSVAEVRTTQQKEEIQGKLKEGLNKRLKAELVKSVFFTEFVTQ
ncbi:MAG: flagellar basal body-associated FliL family protein [Myxococcota bacterium]|jgi:flagellar FliL protein|nr:flagellar basal body-associated FliL family protein [Myxococcota bacterium]